MASTPAATRRADTSLTGLGKPNRSRIADCHPPGRGAVPSGLPAGPRKSSITIRALRRQGDMRSSVPCGSCGAGTAPGNGRQQWYCRRCVVRQSSGQRTQGAGHAAMVHVVTAGQPHAHGATVAHHGFHAPRPATGGRAAGLSAQSRTPGGGDLPEQLPPPAASVPAGRRGQMTSYVGRGRVATTPAARGCGRRLRRLVRPGAGTCVDDPGPAIGRRRYQAGPACRKEIVTRLVPLGNRTLPW